MTSPDETPLWSLVRAAGCEPMASSSNELTFRAPDNSVIHLRVPSGRDWADESRALTRRFREWCADNGITLTPDAIREARTADEIQSSRWAVDRLAREVSELREATVALRLASADRTCIKVWRFHDAPAELRALTSHGGDEDWLALVPPDVGYPSDWFDGGGSFGCCSVSTHDLPDGWTVYIGAHS